MTTLMLATDAQFCERMITSQLYGTEYTSFGFKMSSLSSTMALTKLQSNFKKTLEDSEQIDVAIKPVERALIEDRIETVDVAATRKRVRDFFGEVKKLILKLNILYSLCFILYWAQR